MLRRNLSNLYFSLCLLTVFAHSQAFANKTGIANPDIGLNISFLGQAASSASPYNNGFDFNELELNFSSAVDPYWKGMATLAVHKEESTSAHGHAEYALDAEEVYFENQSLPGVTLKLGKQKLYFGKLNHIHRHAQPFIDEPLTISKVAGDEGLNETVVAFSYLLPTSWFSEVHLQSGNGENEHLFHSHQKGDLAHVAYFKNLWELNASSTAEWILTGAMGENSGHAETELYNTAITYKWRPTVGGESRSFFITAEYTGLDRKKLEDETPAIVTIDPENVQSYWFKYQFQKRWAAGLRYEHAKTYVLNEDSGLFEFIREEKQSAILSFLNTEFSHIHLQYDRSRLSNNNEYEHRVAVLFNFSQGVHPPHNY